MDAHLKSDDDFHISDQSQVANTLRVLLAQLPPGNEMLEMHTRSAIAHMQAARDHNYLRAVHRARNFSMDTIVQTVALSGLLRDVRDIKETIGFAIGLSVPDPKMREFYKESLDKQGANLSVSSIWRHRLTLTMALCCHRQSQYNFMGNGTFTTWRTLDLTPLRGYEWMIHGVITLHNDDCPTALQLANELGTSGNIEDEAPTQEALLRLIGIERGVPCALGSGKQGPKLEQIKHTDLMCAFLVNKQS